MVDLDFLAQDLHQCGYRSVEDAERCGRNLELNKREELYVDSLLIKLWGAAASVSDYPTSQAYP